MLVRKVKNMNSLRPILFQVSPKNDRQPPPGPAGIGLKSCKKLCQAFKFDKIKLLKIYIFKSLK